jgi:hypothetical protein
MKTSAKARLVCVVAAMGLGLPVATASVLYCEDFEDGTADGMTMYGGWTIGSPGLNGSSLAAYTSGSGQHVLRLDGVPSDNVAVDLDFIINHPNGDLDIWLNTDVQYYWPTQGYDAMVNPAGSDNPNAELIATGAPDWLLDSTPNTIHTGEEHHLRMEKFGASLRVLLDYQEILTATDSTWVGGQIAIRTWSNTIVDNICVSTPEPGTLCLTVLGVACAAKRRR